MIKSVNHWNSLKNKRGQTLKSIPKKIRQPFSTVPQQFSKPSCSAPRQVWKPCDFSPSPINHSNPAVLESIRHFPTHCPWDHNAFFHIPLVKSIVPSCTWVIIVTVKYEFRVCLLESIKVKASCVSEILRDFLALEDLTITFRADIGYVKFEKVVRLL